MFVCFFIGDDSLNFLGVLFDSSELAQKGRAEREAKRALHEAGVTKKKEIMAQSIVIKAERQTRLNELEENLKQAEHELKEKEGLTKSLIYSIEK